MKFLVSLAALAMTCFGSVLGASEAILSYNANNFSALANGTFGWAFRPTNSLVVTELGCFANVFEGNSPPIASVQVGLWNDSQVLLASSSITSGSTLSDQTRYEAIIPVALGAGQVYHLGVYYSGGDYLTDFPAPWLGGSVSAPSLIQLVGTAYATNGFVFPPTRPSTAGAIFAGPNFQFQTAPTLVIQSWTNNRVRLSWPTAFPGYSLQSENDLSGGWGAAGLTVGTEGYNYVAYDTIGPGPKYYRLFK